MYTKTSCRKKATTHFQVYQLPANLKTSQKSTQHIYAIERALSTASSLKEMEKFIEHQIQLIETERKIDVEDTLKLLSAYAPIQLQRRGVALVGLKVTGTRF